MPVDKYMAEWAVSGLSPAPTRSRDGTTIHPTIVLEVHEGADGVVRAYAVPPPRMRGEHADLVIEDEMETTLQEAGRDVLMKRNAELSAENAALKAYSTRLEEQNSQLMERLMGYADKALEVLHGDGPTASSGNGAPAKKPRAQKRASNGSRELEQG